MLLSAKRSCNVDRTERQGRPFQSLERLINKLIDIATLKWLDDEYKVPECEGYEGLINMHPSTLNIITDLPQGLEPKVCQERKPSLTPIKTPNGAAPPVSSISLSMDWSIHRPPHPPLGRR